ncbi:EF-hand calcium-binding domain-containing protein 6 [Anguilla anguilla]|uniref:EF-hand calcium-binding domain-containing protein 6 n=1 Tax=Anguilla anguilla TaxID=7936 RepID=UPI0015AC392A|nr:EF-hand calcium-binding domain-containing protein 6 [Anguilla anguilla]
MTAARMTTRMPSVASFRLPVIQHPFSKMGDPETISLRGHTTEGARNHKVFAEERRRPLSHEERLDSVHRSQILKSNRAQQGGNELRLDRDTFTGPPLQIPEGVEVTWAADPDKPRLPIFGQRACAVSRAGSSAGHSVVSSSRASSVSYPAAQLRIQVDQLEHELRQRVRAGGHSTLKNLFKGSDPGGQGQVNRDALLMILAKFLGRSVTVKQLRQLLLRLHLSEKDVLGFEELYAPLMEPVQAGAATSGGPGQHPAAPPQLTASQAHALLRGPAQHSFLEAMKSLPVKDSEGPRWIVAPELRNILEQLHLNMDDHEFEKLWRRYDVDALGAVKVDVLLDKIRKKDRKRPNSDGNPNQKEPAPVTAEAEGASQTPARTLSKGEEERKASITMEKWLKDKFREGFRKMKAEFEKVDPDKSGMVQPDAFLQVLQTFGLSLRRGHVGLFLARCGLKPRKTGIKYTEFLRRFQDRSTDGITHKILANPQHRFNQDENISHASTVTAVEAKLAKMFQSEYLALFDTFRNIDKLDKKTISQEEFRAAIESRFRLEISDPEFAQLLDSLPLDPDGNVQYALFMAPFDTRGGAPSLFESQADAGERDSVQPEDTGKTNQGRSDTQLFKTIKTLVTKHYPAVEQAYQELDEKNTRRLTQETMYQLLKRFDIQPEVSRGEIRRLWGTLITNQDKTLDFLQFARHFGHSPKSACFPNAKLCPPRKGDEDFRLRSKTLNCVSDILVDSVRAKVEFLLYELQNEFEDLDPYRTGFVSQDEFRDILTSLCVHLNQYECHVLAKKFDINHDARVSYVEFLKPFGQPRVTKRTGAHVAEVMQESYRAPDESLEERSSSAMGLLMTRLRKKLEGAGRTLRRSFRKLDVAGSGYLSPSEFSAVLRLCSVDLNHEEVYHILSTFDRGLDGRVDYRGFLQEMC